MDKRLFAIIDGPYLFELTKALGFIVDFKSLREALAERGSIMRCWYFGVVDETREYQGIRPLLDWLDYNGYQIVKIPPRSELLFVAKVAVAALCETKKADEVVFLACDASYAPIARELRSQGIAITVISHLEKGPLMVDDQLRRTADEFIEFGTLRDRIEKKQ